MTDRILVTGAEGFIGSHLVEELVKSGGNVRALTLYNFENRWGWLETLPVEILDEVEIVAGDVCDPFSVRNVVKECTTVFHLAALIAIPYSYTAPASYVRTNVVGTLNVLQACVESSVDRVVHTSTSETYGTAQYTPIDEKHPLVGQSPYSASKIGADKLAESYFLSFSLPVATIRPFNTYGPRQSARAVIPTVITQALAGEQEIKLGALDPVRDLTYVKDTVAGFIAISQTESAIGKVTNIGSGRGISIGDLAHLILDLCNSDAQIRQVGDRLRPKDSEVGKLICDNSFALRNLQWAPKHDLRSGLQETIEWMRDNMNWYKPEIYAL